MWKRVASCSSVAQLKPAVAFLIYVGACNVHYVQLGASLLQEEVWSMAAAEAQDKQALSKSASSNRQLQASLSDVQMVEAFFELEGKLDTAVTAANHPSFTPEVCCCLHIL